MALTDQFCGGIVGSQVLGAARLDSRHGFSAVCDQDRFPLAYLMEQSAEVVLRFANAGPFHLASLARIKRPVKRDSDVTRLRRPGEGACAPGLRPSQCVPISSRKRVRGRVPAGWRPATVETLSATRELAERSRPKRAPTLAFTKRVRASVWDPPSDPLPAAAVAAAAAGVASDRERFTYANSGTVPRMRSRKIGAVA